MSPRKAKPTETLHRIAQDEYDRANQDGTAAVEAMIERITSNDALFREVAAPILRKACQSAIYSVVAARRRKSFDQSPKPQRSKKANERAMRARARATLEGLMAFPLNDGTLLGKATYSKILQTATLYLKRAKTYAHEGRFLMLVANVMKSHRNQVVMRVMTEAQLADLRNEADTEVRDAAQ